MSSVAMVAAAGETPRGAGTGPQFKGAAKQSRKDGLRESAERGRQTHSCGRAAGTTRTHRVGGGSTAGNSKGEENHAQGGPGVGDEDNRGSARVPHARREGAVQGTRCHARTFQILAAGGWKHWAAEVPCWLELWL